MDSFHKKNDKPSGFTLVEVLIVIVVIGILITFTLIAVGDWRKSTAETEVKNDLNSLASAMESARNFSTGYPASIPTTFTANSNVTATYKSGNAASYCVEAASKIVTTVIYHINSVESKEPQSGIC